MILQRTTHITPSYKPFSPGIPVHRPVKIAYIAAGAAGMYCGSCLHDNTLARALLELGEDVILVPTYTPIRTDEEDVSHSRVFFGGINAYLQQHVPLFRYTPRWLDRLLDQRWLLNLVSKRGASVDPAQLGAMTVSMLRGEGGHQAKEVDKLVDWLIDEVQPDVVHLSNSMLLGMARRINERCGPPVVCALSGEDIFLEKLKPPYYEQARELLKERAGEVASFTALNKYYADFMAEYLAVDRAKVHVVPHGLDLHGYHRSQLAELDPEAPLWIGYLARICHDKGFHLLVDACEQLAVNRPDLNFNLWVAGYLGAADRKYFESLSRRIEQGPLKDRFLHLGELSREAKISFMEESAIFCTPTVYCESKGLPAIEAMAAGTPVVLPDHGAFPELVAETGGGLLHRPGDAEHLAERLAELLDDPPRTAQLGAAAQQHVHRHRTSARMAEQTLELYHRLSS